MEKVARKNKIGLFAGSFDPFTRGHAALVDAALRIVDEIVIGIGHNVQKKGLVEPKERKRLIEKVYENEPRVSVEIYTCLTGEFAKKAGATVLIRGVRTSHDMEAERVLEAMNRDIFPELQSLMLFTPAALQHISSSAVRELYAFDASTETMLPEGIKLKDYIK